jgi:hypothetical protein
LTAGRGLQMRVGIPLTGGALPAAARRLGYPVLFSANAFARVFGDGHERAKEFAGFRLPKGGQLDGLDAALDSAGFVAAARYGDYRWRVADYYDLVESFPWTWHASMDYCCEPEVAKDRPLRLLRIAATAQMLAQCQAEAKARGLPAPMPILQGWTPAEYALCARWLPVLEWPALVGLGSVCRRQVDGPNGILSILDAVDAVLPPGVRLHLFGVKSAALALLSKHPRVASADSMAWDMQARAERRTGRDMSFRIGHMQTWMDRQEDAIAEPPSCAALPRSLFDPTSFGGHISTEEEIVLEALALQWADLLLENQVEYRDAVWHAFEAGVWAVAKLRMRGLSTELLEEFNADMDGHGDRVAQLLTEAGLRVPAHFDQDLL